MTGPDLLADCLRTKGITLRDAGRRVGASAAAVMKWRDRKSTPNSKYLGRLRDEFGIPLSAWAEPPVPHKRLPKSRQ